MHLRSNEGRKCCSRISFSMTRRLKKQQQIVEIEHWVNRELGSIYITCKLGNISSHFVDIRSAYASPTREAYTDRIIIIPSFTPSSNNLWIESRIIWATCWYGTKMFLGFTAIISQKSSCTRAITEESSATYRKTI